MKAVYYERHKVVISPINEELAESQVVNYSRDFYITEILEFITHLPLREQVYMICNLLTISGYTQAEIAEALGVAHQTYRNNLLEIRKKFKSDGINAI